MKKFISVIAAVAVMLFGCVGIVSQAFDGGEVNAGRPVYDTRTASFNRIVSLAGDIEETMVDSRNEEESSSSSENSENPSSAADTPLLDSGDGNTISIPEEESKSLEEETNNGEDISGLASEENSKEEDSKPEEEASSQSSSEASSEQSNSESIDSSNSVIDNADTYDGMNFKELMLMLGLSAFAAGLMVFGKREED